MKSKSPRQGAPLRRIRGELMAGPDIFSRKKVTLECGHVVWCSSGAIYRARCWKCHKRLQAEYP